MPFFDTFDRANGPMGSDWQVLRGSCTIVNNAAVLVPVATMVALPLTAAGDLDVGFTLDPARCIDSRVYLVVHANTSYGANMSLEVDAALDVYRIYLDDYDGGYTSVVRASASTPYSGTTPKYFSLTLVGTTWACKVNGTTVCTWVGAGHSSGSTVQVQVANNTAGLLSFNVPIVTYTINVTPDPLWVGGGAQPLLVTGTGTSWTAGVPGSSVVTADHGTISEQWTADTTHIHLTYTPAEYVGPIIVSEAQYGATDTINGTLTPQEGQGTAQCPFNAEFVAMANTTGINQTPGQLTTTSDVVILSPTMNYQDALAYLITLVRNLYPGAPPWSPEAVTPDTRLDLIWDAINGGVAQPQALYSPASDQPVKLDTEQTLAALKALTWNGDYNLATVISDIAGSGGYNLTTLLAAIPTADNQPVLDLLAAIRGDTTTSLYTLLSSLAGIRTIDALSLRDVLQAIDQLPKTMDGGYTPADRIANAAGFAGVLLAIGALAAVEAEDAASSSGSLAGIVALAGELAAGIASVLAALESLKSLLGGGANEYRAPVWPGEAHVEWGTAIAIESNEPLIGEMHGVVVDITGCEGGTRMFAYDGIKCYSHVGALGFCSDRGDMEPFQALGPTKGIYTVKTMASAFACRLFRGRNVRGTIRPWKIKAD